MIMAMKCFVFASLLFASLATASPRFGPTPTVIGLAKQALGEIEVLPTSFPWSPSVLFKRLEGDPAICGWVEGDPSKLLQRSTMTQRRYANSLILQDNTVSCNSGYTCAATNTFVGCCSTGGGGCGALFTTCYDGTGPSCDSACSANTAALIWSVHSRYEPYMELTSQQ